LRRVHTQNTSSSPGGEDDDDNARYDAAKAPASVASPGEKRKAEDDLQFENKQRALQLGRPLHWTGRDEHEALVQQLLATASVDADAAPDHSSLTANDERVEVPETPSPPFLVLPTLKRRRRENTEGVPGYSRTSPSLSWTDDLDTGVSMLSVSPASNFQMFPKTTADSVEPQLPTVKAKVLKDNQIYDSGPILVNGEGDSVHSAIQPPYGCRLDQMSDDIELDLERTKLQSASDCWTCTPSESIPKDAIPIYIDGLPVVIPVRSIAPLVGIPSPPPDPHPHFIDPTQTVTDDLTGEIFQTFTEASGFYLLINGWLQLIVLDSFDHKEALSTLPTEFGRLKVSFVPQNQFPTAGDTSNSVSGVAPTSPSSMDVTASTSTSTSPFSRAFQSAARLRPGLGSRRSSQTPTSATTASSAAPELRAGNAVRAVAKSGQNKTRFEGKMGVVLSKVDGTAGSFMTVPTHLFTNAILASRAAKPLSPTWTKEVSIIEASTSNEVRLQICLPFILTVTNRRVPEAGAHSEGLRL
jgi:hypothetical protein